MTTKSVQSSYDSNDGYEAGFQPVGVPKPADIVPSRAPAKPRRPWMKATLNVLLRGFWQFVSNPVLAGVLGVFSLVGFLMAAIARAAPDPSMPDFPFHCFITASLLVIPGAAQLSPWALKQISRAVQDEVKKLEGTHDQTDSLP